MTAPKPRTARAKPTITLAELRAKRACADQIAEFEALFPSGSVVVTVAKARKVANSFNWNWAASTFLKATASAAYEQERATALATYRRATAMATATERATPWAAYRQATATAFASAFIAQHAGKAAR